MKNVILMGCLLGIPAVLSAQAPRVELDHVFIAVPAPGTAEVEALQRLGFTVDTAVMRHTGQGTASRSLLFENVYLELIWVDTTVGLSLQGHAVREDTERAASWRSTGASPFGLGLRGAGVADDYGVPVTRYSSEWMQPGSSIAVLKQAHEPEAAGLFVVPPYMAVPAWIDRVREHVPHLLLHGNGSRRVSAVALAGPASHRPSATRVLGISGLTFNEAEAPLLTLELDSGQRNVTHDLRPLLPLLIRR
jgi:hypothetical protein